jgi:hypothetical protein
VECEPGATGPAFDAFVRTHARSLFGTAYLLCGDRIDHADAALAYVRRALVHRHIDAQ